MSVSVRCSTCGTVNPSYFDTLMMKIEGEEFSKLRLMCGYCKDRFLLHLEASYRSLFFCGHSSPLANAVDVTIMFNNGQQSGSIRFCDLKCAKEWCNVTSELI